MFQKKIGAIWSSRRTAFQTTSTEATDFEFLGLESSFSQSNTF